MTARRVAITGVGVVTAAVVGGAADLAGWLHGSGHRGAPNGSSAAPADGRGPVDTDRLLSLVDPEHRRRLSRVCQLTVAAARLALADAGVGPDGLGLVVGTELGDLRSTMEFVDGFLARGPAGLSPLLFPNTVMNTMASATAIAVQARAGTLTLTAPAVAGELAVARAAAAVGAGRLDLALAGGVDELADEVAATIAALGAKGDVRGEGAAFLVLEPLAAARARGAQVLGEIRSAVWRGLRARPWGVGRAAAGPAVAEAMAVAGVSRERIGWVYCSAGGDDARDAWEARLLKSVFGDAGPPMAALAWTLGRHAATGAVTVAAGALTAQTGRLPSVVTSGDEADLAVPRGPGLIHGLARGGTHVALIVDGAGDMTDGGNDAGWSRRRP